MSRLDDPKLLEQLDPQGMIELIRGFPEQCEDALTVGRRFLPRIGLPHVNEVVVCGVGGSAIAGDMLGALLRDSAGCPIITNRDYSLPASVNSDSLVIAASYSGDTEETLAAYDEACERGAIIVCVTTGGELARRAKLANDKDRVSLLELPNEPKGRQPRSATGYMFIPMLVALEKLGITSGWGDQVEAAIEPLRQMREALRPETPEGSNPAKQLARRLYKKLPVIYGAVGLTGVVANRWKCQFNENAKSHAFTNVFPELDHNEILGWEQAMKQSKRFVAVLIRDPDDTSRNSPRADITRRVIDGDYKALDVLDVHLTGKSPLEKMLTGFYRGDFTSAYLGLLYGTDITEVRGIEKLKAQMAETPMEYPTPAA